MIDQKAQDYFYRNVWQSNIHLFKHSGENLVKEINKTKPKFVIDAGCGLNFFKGKIPNLVGYDPVFDEADIVCCLLYTSPSPRDRNVSRMPSSA